MIQGLVGNLLEVMGLSRAGSGALFSIRSCSTEILRACIDRQAYYLGVKRCSTIRSTLNQKYIVLIEAITIQATVLERRSSRPPSLGSSENCVIVRKDRAVLRRGTVSTPQTRATSRRDIRCPASHGHRQ